MSDESEKKSSGKPYVDLEHAKFLYLPTMKEGHWTVLAKLQAAEYTPSKSGEGKGRPTGKQKILVFNYRLDGGKWTEVEQPKWEDVDVTRAPRRLRTSSFRWRGSASASLIARTGIAPCAGRVGFDRHGARAGPRH